MLVRKEGLRKYPPNLIWIMPAQGAVTSGLAVFFRLAGRGSAAQARNAVNRPDLTSAIDRLRTRGPLVHNITNYVVMNSTANALLAVGASPAMVHAEAEVADFAPIAQALVINIGTLSPPWVAAMEKAAEAANAAGVPWILDPVATGATAYRTETATRLVALKPTIIRGNASEIMSLAGEAGGARGVDSTQGSDAAQDAAKRLSQQSGAVVAVTGAVDYVTDGERIVGLANGDPMLARVTGTGCMATAIVGAFLGAGLAPFDACAAGLTMLGVAAETAIVGAKGPASFQVALIDALYRLDDAALEEGVRWA
ncbi:hydroxyethylthiazole kinase [Bauldia litoralis]|uniref:Hydroxyethylthiazole kinase n=1 Tax=Bauldia litoralis TaxID=665467 RepID=A0A1G6AGA3_9HYPH|nr:hydroxyethylthiazole kinase [Bauldia litoralis]